MKVVIVSTPRTCSGFLCNIFDKKFDLIDYSELFSDVWLKASPELKLKMVNRSDNFVMKLTSTSLLTNQHLFTLQTFPWKMFDYIIVTERSNIAQQLSSWWLLSSAQIIGKGDQDNLVKYLREGLLTPHELPAPLLDQATSIVKTINHFREEVKPYLLNSGLKSVKLVNHEMFQKPREEYIEELRDKTDVYWRMEDLVENNPTYVDYTPYIEAHNIRQLIDDIQHTLKNPNATKEENNTAEQPIENEGIV